MKKSGECRTNPRAVSTGPPKHLDVLDAFREQDDIAVLDDVELDEQLAKSEMRGGLVDHDAHCAFSRVGAQVDDALREPLVEHRGHCDQHLAIEIATIGLLARRLLHETNARDMTGFFNPLPLKFPTRMMFQPK